MKHCIVRDGATFHEPHNDSRGVLERIDITIVDFLFAYIVVLFYVTEYDSIDFFRQMKKKRSLKIKL